MPVDDSGIEKGILKIILPHKKPLGIDRFNKL